MVALKYYLKLSGAKPFFKVKPRKDEADEVVSDNDAERAIDAELLVNDPLAYCDKYKIPYSHYFGFKV